MTICAFPDERHQAHAMYLPGGETVTVRPACPQDTDRIQAYIRALLSRFAAQSVSWRRE
jgi:hypothetical protein